MSPALAGQFFTTEPPGSPELYEVFVYFANQALVSHIIWKYFLPARRLFFHFVYGFLVAPMVKNLPAVQDTWVRSLEKGTATHSMDRGAWWDTVHGVAKSWTRLSN